MKFKTVYQFSVIDEIEEGETVYCLDKKDRCVFTVNDLSCENALGLLRDAKDDDERFEFWKEIKENDG